MEQTYIKFYDWIIQCKVLTGSMKLVYALIYQMTKRSEHGWYGGYDLMARRLDITKRSCTSAVDDLVNLRAVTKETRSGRLHLLANPTWAEQQIKEYDRLNTLVWM